jgi:hypothetical protein
VRSQWLVVDVSGDRPRAELHFTGHRVPRVAAITVEAATALTRAGVRTFVRGAVLAGAVSD